MKQRSASILEYGSTRFPELFEWCSARITQVTSSTKTSALDKQLALCTELHDKLFAEDVTLPACVSGGFPTLLSRAVHHSYANGAVQASACLLSADLIRSGCCAETEIPIAHGELSIYTHLLAQVASVPEDVGASIALMLGHAVTMSDTSNAADKLSQRVLSDKSPVWPCLQGLCDDATFASQPQKRQCFLGLIDLLRICIVVPAVCPTLAGTAEHLAPIVTSLTKSKDAVLLDPVLELLVALQLAATPNTAMTTTLTAAVTELLAASPTPKVPSPLARFASEVFGLGTHKTEFGVKKLMAAVMLCRMPNADASAKLKLLRVLGDDAPSMGPAMSVVLLCVPETLSCVLHFLGHDQPRLACAVLRACLAAAPSGTPTEFRPYQERAGHRLCLRGAIVMLENLMGSESASETRQDAILACRSLLSYPHTTSHVAVIASQCASLVADLIHAHASREEIKNTVEDEALLSAAFDLLQSLEDDELRCATPFDTFTDIATIIIPAGVISTPVTVSGVRLLRRYASIHPIEAAITLDLQFMAQRLAMPEALLEVDAILIEGFLSIMSAIVSKEPKVVTLEWVDCLSALVGFMTTDHGKQHAGIRREYWRCVLQTVHANPDSKEYVLNDSQTHLSESIELELSAKDSGSKLVEANLCILVDVAASVDIPSEDLIRAMAKLTEGAISLAQEDLKLSLIHFFSACSVAAPNDVLTTSLLALLRSSTGGKVVEGNPALTAMCCAGAKVAMYLTKWAATLVDGTVASEWSLPTLLTITSIILRDNVLARQPFVATELVGLSINLMQRASDPHSPLWRASKALVDALSSAFFVKPGEEIKLAGEQLFRYPLFFPFLEALRKKSTDAKQYPELHGARTSTYALLEHLLHAHGVTEEEFCSSEDFRKFFTQHTLIHLNDPICSTFATLMLRNQRLRRWLIAAHREMYFGALSQLKSDAVDAQKKNVFEGYVKEMS